MVQTRIEGRLEIHDKELSKIPIIEKKLTSISQNMEDLQAQAEKTHQMVMIFMETMARERTIASGKMTESTGQVTATTKSAEGESSMSKEIKNDMPEKKSDNEGENND